MATSGFVEDQEIKLTSREIVSDVTDFRNTVHFRYKADLFVPRGGRPEAFNTFSVAGLLDAQGKLHQVHRRRCQLVLHSAIPPLPQEAQGHHPEGLIGQQGYFHLKLELIGLGLADAQYMTFPEGSSPPDLYQAYVKDTQARVSEDVALGVGCICAEYERLEGTKPCCVTSGGLSQTITDRQDELEASPLFDGLRAGQGVLPAAILRTLLDEASYAALVGRLPDVQCPS